LEAYAHQEVPFEKVVEAVVKERDLSRSPLFQVMFVYQNTPEVPVLQLGELQLSAETFENTTTQFDLTCMISRQEDGIYATIHYCTDLYEHSTIERLSEHFQNLLTDITKNPQKKIGDLELLSKIEVDSLLNKFNNTKAEFPKNKTIVDLFEDQVAKTPDSIAVKFEETELSYKELNERSNNLAHYLRGKGVKEETLVPICIQRSAEMIIGILGILKSGGAYVPIDPAYPQDRINFMLEDTGAKIVLTDAASQLKLDQKQIELIDITKDIPNDKQNNNLTLNNLTSNNLAYIIYTSGSTGKPKGVLIDHHNVVRLFKTEPALYQFTANDVWTVFHSFAFDFSVWEMYGALLFGGKMVIVPSNIAKDTTLFAKLLQKEGVTILNQTPSAFYVLQDYLISEKPSLKLRYVIFGGEALNPGKLDAWEQNYPKAQLINMYGITETTVHVSYKEIGKKEIGSKRSIIGKPIPTLQAYVMDANGKPQPIGVPGELYIGGDGVARGYLNRPELTNEKFINDPYTIGNKLYKSGDLGRWLEDGELEYLGRIDDQVKIRGFRIELGEIEACIEQSELTLQNVVVAQKDNSGAQRLVGYIVPSPKYDRSKLDDFLKTLLPEYMVPGIWVELDQLPLTSNGKIDKKSLPDPDFDQMLNHMYVEPQNQIQQELAEVWQDLLGVEKVGIYDNFFDLGGHSLLAMRVISALRLKLNTELEIRELFSHPTIISLSEHLLNRQSLDMLPSITKAENAPEYIPLSFAQERIWYIDKLEGSIHYHIPSVLKIEGVLDSNALEKAFKKVIERHEVLRTVFLQHDGLVYQKVKDAALWKLIQNENPVSNIEEEINTLINKPFDLSADYAFRANLLKTVKTEHVLVMVMHHIASDGWSTSILVEEVISYYEAICRGEELPLNPLPLQYSDVAIWQKNYLSGEFLNKKLSYWETQLADVSPMELPIDKPRPSVLTTNGAALSFALGKETTHQLDVLSRKSGTTMFMTLLAGFKVLLHKYSNQNQILVGTPTAGRLQKETEGLIGNFINTLVLKSEIDPNESFSELLKKVKQTTLDAYSHQEVPIEKIIDAVVLDRDLSRSPLFQVLFVFQNTPEVPELKLGDAKLTPMGTEHTRAKFELSLNMSQYDEGLSGELLYNTDLFNSSTIQRFKNHFVSFLNDIANYGDLPISAIELIDTKQKSQLLLQGKSEVSYNPKQTVLDMLQAQTAQHPTKNALVDGEKSLTYEQLQKRSNQIANLLREKGVKPGSPVVLYVEQGLDRIAGIVGILKSGAAYVPIDTEFPLSRIEYILSDTKAKHILSTGSLVKTLDTTAELIDLDKEINQPTLDPTLNIPSNSPAYIIYTSGSTGQPKGVTISHGNLMDYVHGLDKRIQISKCTSYALLSSIATDLGNTVIYSSLVFGGTLHVFTKEQVRSAEYLQNYFNHNSIDCLKIVPSHWKALSEQSPLLPKELLIFGGESLPPQTLTMIYQTQSSCRVVNHYGPTETTIGKLLHEADKTKTYNTSVPIGTPFGNTQVYVLSPWKTLTPVGVPGELYIGGEGVSQGYWNNEPLTQEKFISNPIEQTPERLYATGDRVKYLEDGTIEYLGRVDDQVKIRGYRVEPMEIERIMDKSGLVQMAAIEVKQDSNANKYLVGYIVPNTSYSKDKLTQYLKQNLPEYMIPGRMMEMESFPMLPNGKINRRSLPEPDLAGMIAKNYVAPSTPTEHTLVDLWQELLELDKIGINDNFFELGGHSLMAFRVISGVRRELDLELELIDLVKNPTISELAKILDFQKENPDFVRNEDED